MREGAMANSCWDKKLEEIRRRVNERRFWQDVAATEVTPDASAENADKNRNLSSKNSANSHADNTVRAMATCPERSNPDKALAGNELQRSRTDRSARETENGQVHEEIPKKSTAAGTFVRWCKFNFVGGIGIVVQFAVLFFLKSVLHLNYLVATALAVEIAVLHNFLWHERFTWVDRLTPAQKQTSGAKAPTKENSFIATLKRCATQNRAHWGRCRPATKNRDWWGHSGCAAQNPRGSGFARLVRFHLGNGLVSIVGNVALMKLMVGEGHVNYLAANVIAIALCSVANFLVSDRWVFEAK